MPVQPVSTVVVQLNAAASAIFGSFPTEAGQLTDAADTIISQNAKRASAVTELGLQIDQLEQHVQTFGIGNGNGRLALTRARDLLPLLA